MFPIIRQSAVPQMRSILTTRMLLGSPVRFFAKPTTIIGFGDVHNNEKLARKYLIDLRNKGRLVDITCFNDTSGQIKFETCNKPKVKKITEIMKSLSRAPKNAAKTLLVMKGVLLTKEIVKKLPKDMSRLNKDLLFIFTHDQEKYTRTT
jgi:hypothetical protein